MKNFGNSSRGRSQGVPKIFRAPMYRAHCTVIFAIAQLSREVPHWLCISKFTRLRAVSRRQHGSCLRQCITHRALFSPIGLHLLEPTGRSVIQSATQKNLLQKETWCGSNAQCGDIVVRNFQMRGRSSVDRQYNRLLTLMSLYSSLCKERSARGVKME